jgi:hypothetical protein
MTYIIEEEIAGNRSAFIDWLDSEDLYITYWDGETEGAE